MKERRKESVLRREVNEGVTSHDIGHGTREQVNSIRSGLLGTLTPHHSLIASLTNRISFFCTSHL